MNAPDDVDKALIHYRSNLHSLTSKPRVKIFDESVPQRYIV